MREKCEKKRVRTQELSKFRPGNRLLWLLILNLLGNSVWLGHYFYQECGFRILFIKVYTQECDPCGAMGILKSILKDEDLCFVNWPCAEFHPVWTHNGKADWTEKRTQLTIWERKRASRWFNLARNTKMLRWIKRFTVYQQLTSLEIT